MGPDLINITDLELSRLRCREYWGMTHVLAHWLLALDSCRSVLGEVKRISMEVEGPGSLLFVLGEFVGDVSANKLVTRCSKMMLMFVVEFGSLFEAVEVEGWFSAGVSDGFEVLVPQSE